MTRPFKWLSPAIAVLLIVSAACASAHRPETMRLPMATPWPCATDSNFQRLAFWVGDWDVDDSLGSHYATQRVHEAVDACAITAEWAGPAGGKGLSLFAFDRRTGEWRQVFVSNQVPSPSGVQLRKSDSSYRGPGLRFIPLLDQGTGDKSVTRVTIEPRNDHGALQLFETSTDGGKSWRTVFKAEHHLHRDY